MNGTQPISNIHNAMETIAAPLTYYSEFMRLNAFDSQGYFLYFVLFSLCFFLFSIQSAEYKTETGTIC